ncbi:F-box/WD repeat-containing protein 10-like [Indicator indicator]|uniref:F-box/WD repeat-containing protein 10-like n=1 Tax=Indicator indicator TaxID=1002788 RepID=UPI0023DF28FC|nr:F-box/WD repeat-containing protein 10-like [Indicator indicator]
MTLPATKPGAAGTRQRQAGCQPSGMCFRSPNTKEAPGAKDSSALLSLSNRSVPLAPAPLQAPSNATQHKDFIRCLPPHLSMSILGLLDQKSLKACAAVNRFWAFLAKEVEKERACQSMVQEKIQYLQGLCPRGAVINYAKIVDVTIPQLNKEGEVTRVKDNDSESQVKVGWKEEEEDNLQAAYHDIKTDTVQLEERNIFCGCYNIRVLLDQTDRSRVIHYDGGDLVATGSADRQVRFLDLAPERREVLPVLSGHVGSIKALFLNEKKGSVLSTGFDLSIRYWDIYSGACLKIFHGHSGTVTCLDLHEEHFVSGARDGTLKVWDLELGKCLRTLKHGSPVWAVRMDGHRLISGCERGRVKVWSADKGALIKTLEGHQGPVKCMTFDQWHLVTGSADGYVLGWSMLGKLKRCLTAFRHPKEVLSLQFLYLRVISGCADGKIRIFNYLTGSCLKVLTASSRGDPASAFCVAEDRMVINTPTSLLLYEFEDVWWDYTLDTDREVVGKTKRFLGNYSTKWLQLQQAQEDLSQLHHLGGEAQAEDDARPQITLNHQKKKTSSCTISPYKFLLTISTLQNTRREAQGSSGTKHAARDRETWRSPRQTLLGSPWRFQRQSYLGYTWKAPRQITLGYPWKPPRDHHPSEAQSNKTSLLSRKDQSVQLQYVRLQSGSSTLTRFSVPFETKPLQLKMDSSLYGPAVKSSIPPPSVVRPKSSGLLQGKKGPSDQGEVPLQEDEEELIDPFMASSKLIRSTRVIMAQMPNQATCRRKSVFCPRAADFCEFRLLTGKQEEENAAAAAAQYQAHQTKLREDEQRARRKAWLRKIKGLPVDSFPGEGKTAAPELGYKPFL